VNKSRTLFATHFHILADMAAHFDKVAYHCTDIVQDGESWTYMHKLKRGVNCESHALKVAKLAGMPEEAVGVAAEVLADFQRRKDRGGSSAQLPLTAVAATA
jgi:DNA mismatch repair ATPase MutS